MVITITPSNRVWNQDALDRTHILLKIKSDVPDIAFRIYQLQNTEEKICLATYTNCPQWWSQAGSNRRPPECKSGALPSELWPHDVVGLGRFELPTSPLSGVRSNQLSYRPSGLR